MKELLEYIVKEMVSKPKEVKVEESSEGDTVNLTFSVGQDDMGLVIGKEGRTISAIRTLVKTAATKAGKNVRVELKE